MSSPEFVNLTGRFIPERNPLVRLRHFLVDQRVEEVFWTAERIQLAQKIVEVVNEELEPFGAPKIEFHQDQVRLLKKKKGNLGGQYHPESGYIDYILTYPDSEPKFVRVFTHEILHHLSLGLVEKRKDRRFWQDKLAWRRGGLEVRIKPGQRKTPWLFKDLDEGVVKKTTRLILQKHFSLEYPETYSETLIEGLCTIIYNAVNEDKYHSPEDVFRVFQKATFGGGRLLELGRLMKMAYGKDGFRKMGDLLRKVPLKGNTTEIDVESLQYKELMRFILSPRRQYEVAGEKIVIDLSLVPDRIPLFDFYDPERRKHEGVLKNVMGYLSTLSAVLTDQEIIPYIFGGDVQNIENRLATVLNGELFQRQVLALSGHYERPGGRETLRYKRVGEVVSPVLDSGIDRVVKDLVFTALGKEEKSVATFKGKDLEMDLYRTKNLSQAPFDIYCLVARRFKDGLTACALAVAPKGVDPQVWWQNH